MSRLIGVSSSTQRRIPCSPGLHRNHFEIAHLTHRISPVQPRHGECIHINSTMQIQLTLHATLAFVGGLAAGSLLAIGSSVAANTLILASSSPGEDCGAVIPLVLPSLDPEKDETKDACVILDDIG
jgi:hypothetical protein